jgi:hypothetical protein
MREREREVMSEKNKNVIDFFCIMCQHRGAHRVTGALTAVRLVLFVE